MKKLSFCIFFVISFLIGNWGFPKLLKQIGKFLIVYEKFKNVEYLIASSLSPKTIKYFHSGKVKIIFKDFPLNGFDSKLAAEASYCAQDQEKYWEYHDELYKNWGGEKTGWITRESLTKFAETVDLDIEKFNKCLDDHKYENKVDLLYAFGKEIGIDATPSFLVFNDQKMIKIRGNQPLEVFLKTFDEF